MKCKRFNRDAFITALFVCVILTAISLFLGSHGTNTVDIWWFFARLYDVFRFPIHIIFSKFILNHDWVYYIGGLLIDCAFYALIIEKVYSLFNKKSKFPPPSARI